MKKIIKLQRELEYFKKVKARAIRKIAQAEKEIRVLRKEYSC